MKAVDRLLSFYPPLDVNDPKAFIAGIVALFARYPAELHEAAVEPASGLPARLASLTSIARIREHLDDLYDPIARRLTRERIANEFRALPKPPRTPEQQAAIDAQVALWRDRRIADEP